MNASDLMTIGTALLMAIAGSLYVTLMIRGLVGARVRD